MKLYTSFLLLLISFSAFATHNKGGEITYQHISGFTYQIKVTTYTKTSGNSIQADRSFLDSVPFGDGTFSLFDRTGFVDLAGDPILDNNTRVNTYMNTHTYPAEGVYTISLKDYNRNADIINIPNSVNVAFSIQTDIVVFDPAIHCVNNSVIPSQTPFFLSAVGTPYIHNPAAFDPDGDSLSFELVPCNSDLNTPVPGYFYPPGITINSLNGEIKWNGNNTVGTYNIAVKISEWRQQIKVGYVTRDFEIIVFPSAPSYYFGNTSTIPVDPGGNFSVNVQPANPVNLSFYFEDVTAASVSLRTLEENFSSNAPTITLDNSIPNKVQVNFQWVPDASQIRNNPYIFVFRGKTGATSDSLEDDLSLMVFVNGTYNDLCPSFPNFYTAVNDFNQDDFNIKFLPNPAHEKITIQIPNFTTFNVDVYDLMGNKLMSFNRISSGFQFNVKELSDGMYIYKCTGSAGNLVRSGIFVKE
jgi:hypothetical protein